MENIILQNFIQSIICCEIFFQLVFEVLRPDPGQQEGP